MNNNILVFIEISKDSNLKYEYDSNKKILQLDRVLPYKLNYPFNYGYLPNTMSDDGQELDVVILLDEPLIPGTIMPCKIIGGLEYSDEKGKDNKLIVCPANNVDIRFKNINDISNLKKETLQKIKWFFKNYKNNLNIKPSIGKFLNSAEANNYYWNSKC